MSEFIAGKQLRKLLMGIKVERATATLPASTAVALFNIRVGRVAITQILGEVTVAIQNQANATKLTGNPTTGTSVDICATLDIDNDEVGTLYGIAGLPATAMIGINAGAVPAQERDVILNIGTLDLDCAATNTGSVKWTLFYIPIDDGAYVEAA
jgi:hypothetical protein